MALGHFRVLSFWLMQYGSINQDGSEVHLAFVMLVISVAKLLFMSHGGYNLTGITSQDGDKATWLLLLELSFLIK